MNYSLNAGNTLAGLTLGLEMEMPVINAQTGCSALVNRYFSELAQIKYFQNENPKAEYIKERCIGLKTPYAHCGLDNGFNLLETALAPIKTTPPNNLLNLAWRAHKELDHSMQALKTEGLALLNASQHPDCKRDTAWYQWACVPRPIYYELLHYRRWDHKEGIDAKAQNGVNISVPIQQACDALNIAIGLAAASIALFANSPLENGRPSHLKETRLTLWPNMFKSARFPGDYFLQQYPDRPFQNLADYFNWMFKPPTVSRSLPLHAGTDYKNTLSAFLMEHNSLYDFLYAGGAMACFIPDHSHNKTDGHSFWLEAQSHHFVYSQIAHFLDARLRYQLEEIPPLNLLLQAWSQPSGLEHLFTEYGVTAYIEGRAPGANFTDACLLEVAGQSPANSLLIAPSALQLGCLRNKEEALALIDKWGWNTLKKLRKLAIQHGLEHPLVFELCRQVASLAKRGLHAEEQKYLSYIDFALETRQCGADRLLASWHSLGLQADKPARLQLIAERHSAIAPDFYTA